METTNRRYDIDWLRVLAIGLLLIYHVAIGFQPWGVFIGFIQNEKPLESLWIPMSMLNTWRIPLLFFVSGMGVCFAMRKRNWRELLLERTRRILLPFVFGIILIAPIHQFIWQKYYSQDIRFYPHPGHLWFLGNIFLYVMLLSPVFYFLKKNEEGAISRWIKKWFTNPMGMVLITGSFILEVVWVKPGLFEAYALTLHGFLLGLLSFFWGFLIVYSGNAFWQNLLKWRWLLLSGAIVFFLVRLMEYKLKAPLYLMAVESTLWIFAVFGFGHKYLNRPGKTLRYLSQAVYPIYIIHMIMLYLGALLIFPRDIPVPIKFLLLLVFTTAGCFIIYDFVIRRTGFLRPMFGLKKGDHSFALYQLTGVKKSVLLVLLISFLLAGCTLNSPGQYTYHPPDNIQDGIATGTLQEVNLRGEYLTEAVNQIHRGRYKEVHSILIFRDDKLVFEEYFQGHQYQWDGPGHHGKWVTWDRNMLHQIASDTKSITSACIGIAIDRDFISSVHQSIFDYLPEYQYLGPGGKDKITIEHLLTMTSGLAWDEWDAPLSSPANDIIGLWFNCEDQIACILERPQVYEPGIHFTYCGGNMILLGEIIRNATEMKIDEFSRQYLFEPLGINSTDWFIRYPNGVIESAGGLKLTPRDMLKFGVTYLQRGTWKGKRILPEEWVEKSATPYRNNQGIRVPLEDSGKNGYAYSWWIHEFRHSGQRIRMFYAGGWGGQLIMVIPELNAVVVFTGGNYTSKRPAFKIFREYIIPSFG